jgi:hypothetical protein
VQDDAEDENDQVMKPAMICFDIGDIVGQTFLMEKMMMGFVAALASSRFLMTTRRRSLTTPYERSSSASLVKTNSRRFFLAMKSCNTLRRTMIRGRPSGNSNGSLETKAL